MKRIKLFWLIALGVLLIAMASGCNKSLQQRIEQAKGASEGEEYREKQKAEAEVENEYQDEWKDFRADAESQIADNDKNLGELRTKLTTADEKVKAQFNSSLEALTHKNEDLKKRLNAYQDDGKVNWDAFKRDATHDLDGLGNALKDLSKEIKK